MILSERLRGSRAGFAEPVLEVRRSLSAPPTPWDVRSTESYGTTNPAAEGPPPLPVSKLRNQESTLSLLPGLAIKDVAAATATRAITATTSRKRFRFIEV